MKQAFQQMLWDGPDGAGAEQVGVATSQSVSILHVTNTSLRGGGGPRPAGTGIPMAGPGRVRSARAWRACSCDECVVLV